MVKGEGEREAEMRIDERDISDADNEADVDDAS